MPLIKNRKLGDRFVPPPIKQKLSKIGPQIILVDRDSAQYLFPVSPVAN
jgi:hypothetical protein